MNLVKLPHQFSPDYSQKPAPTNSGKFIHEVRASRTMDKFRSFFRYSDLSYLETTIKYSINNSLGA